MDSREPTIDDPVYDRKNPLYIEDATGHENVYSARTDTSAGFLTHLVAQYVPWDDTYMAPAYAVDKCTVIRATLFDLAGNSVDSIYGTYFVGLRNREAYQDVYIASLVISPKNLFDNDNGIYVRGSTFDRYLKEDRFKEVDHWYSWESNYSNRGSEWERDAHITLFDDHQEMILSQECGIRIKGDASRGLLPRSIKCYARAKYNGNDMFDTDFFESYIFPHKIALFAGGNDSKFKAKDYIVNTITQDLNFATMDFIPCAMFLDGEYWGMYHITEDYDNDYIHDHYQVAKDNIIMIKNNTLTEGNDGEREIYKEMMDFISEQDMSVGANYNRACDLIDIDSYIDYYATQIYIANCDWDNRNFALWRARENDGSRYGDGRWRWMLFDVNYGGPGAEYVSMDGLSYALKVDSTFSSLYKNETFRRQFAKRLLYIGKEVFAPEKCNQFIDEYVQTLEKPLAASNKRFYMDEKTEEFEQYIADIRTFFDNRYEVVWDFLTDHMGEEWLSQNGIEK